MEKNRLEAFSDGVIAIIITIMVLELKVKDTDHGGGLGELKELLPVFLSYVLSFIYVGIYWNNHHHMFHTTKKVTGGILWANLNALFWLSLFPFSTAWVGRNHDKALPVAIYGCVLLMAALGYFILQRAIIAQQGHNSLLAKAVGKDWKGKISPVLYVAGILFAGVNTRISIAFYVFVALMWLIPDRRIENALMNHERKQAE